MPRGRSGLIVDASGPAEPIEHEVKTPVGQRVLAHGRPGLCEGLRYASAKWSTGSTNAGSACSPPHAGGPPAGRPTWPPVDPQSVVSGTRVVGRVEIGGRRYSKNKTNYI